MARSYKELPHATGNWDIAKKTLACCGRSIFSQPLSRWNGYQPVSGKRPQSLVAVQAALQGQVPGRCRAEAGLEEFQQQAAARTGFALQAQGVDAAGFRRRQAGFAEQWQQFAAQQVIADQPGRQVGDAQAGEGAEQQGFGVVGGHAQAFRSADLQLAVDLEAPGVGWRQAVPVEAVVLDQCAGRTRHDAPRQVTRAGADHPHQRREGGGDQAGVGQRADAQHQVDFAEVGAVQVDEAVDQAQLYIQPRIGDEKFGNRRCQVAPAEWRWRVDADQALWRAAQRYGLGTGQVQLREDAPGALGKGLSRRGGAYRVGAATEQAAAERALQGIDPSGHGRRGERMAPGGGGEAAAFQYVEKQAELVG